MISNTPANAIEVFANPTHLGIADYSNTIGDKMSGMMEYYLNLVQARWQPEAIDCTNDKEDSNRMTEAQKQIFLLNLLYQTMMDTGQARMPDLLKRLACDPRLELYLNEHSVSEAVHARSYTYILNNLFDPVEVQTLISEIYSNVEIIKRASTILNPYNRLDKEISKMILEESPNESLPDSVKELVLDCCISTFILEKIRFNNSFVCSFSFKCQSDLFTGITSIMRLIARDENIHVAAFLFIIRTLLQDSFYKECFIRRQNHYIDMWKVAMEEEMAWAKYIFSKGPVKGLDESILTERIKYVVQKGMRLIGLPSKELFSNSEGKEIEYTNPTKWVEDYIVGNTVQQAPQAASVDDYKFTEIVDDLSPSTLASLKDKFSNKL